MLKKNIKIISTICLIIGYVSLIILGSFLIKVGWPTKKIIVNQALEAYEQRDYSLSPILLKIWVVSVAFILAGLIIEFISKVEHISMLKKIKSMFKEIRSVFSFVIEIMAVYFVVLAIFTKVNWSNPFWWLMILTASLLLLLSKKLRS